MSDQEKLAEIQKDLEDGGSAYDHVFPLIDMINQLQEIKGVSGVHIMAFRQEHRAAEIVKRSEVLGDREPWRPGHQRVREGEPQ